MRKFLTLLTVLMLYCALAFAQTRPVTGQVRDAEGNPVPFASVKIKGSNTGTSADAEGRFTITTQTGDVLVITAVGMPAREVTVGADNNLVVSMARGNEDLSEVVVTAFGIKREKKALGYAVQEVKGEDLTVAKSLDVSSSLAGKVAGVKL
ncbi:MAG TPA: carboxypeptidase-like regulatory domain-containing protein, partial [Chitinophagaceae bacterium]